MAKTGTSWKAGKSGNPRGRPPKVRSLTEYLKAGGDRMVYDDYGRLLSAKEATARLLWEFATRGEISLSGRIMEAESTTEWLNVVKWIYQHVDGGAETEGRAAADNVDDGRMDVVKEGESFEQMVERLKLKGT